MVTAIHFIWKMMRSCCKSTSTLKFIKSTVIYGNLNYLLKLECAIHFICYRFYKSSNNMVSVIRHSSSWYLRANKPCFRIMVLKNMYRIINSILTASETYKNVQKYYKIAVLLYGSECWNKFFTDEETTSTTRDVIIYENRQNIKT